MHDDLSEDIRFLLNKSAKLASRIDDCRRYDLGNLQILSIPEMYNELDKYHKIRVLTKYLFSPDYTFPYFHINGFKCVVTKDYALVVVEDEIVIDMLVNCVVFKNDEWLTLETFFYGIFVSEYAFNEFLNWVETKMNERSPYGGNYNDTFKKHLNSLLYLSKKYNKSEEIQIRVSTILVLINLIC